MRKYNSNLGSLITLLNDGKFHDGSTVGKKLKITRSAIWKAIQKLKTYGIKIDSTKGKGYALSEPLILLDRQEIIKNLTDTEIIIDILESIDSTNTYLRSFTNSQAKRICIAEQQTQGRGRLNRSWHSPFAQNIHLSLFYPFKKDVSELAGLSLLVSLAIVKTLQKYVVDGQLQVKWPNDVILNQKKLAGSLIEVQAEANGSCSAIIGIGLNVNMTEDKKHQITQTWTSLKNELNCYIDRNLLCSSLINNLMDYLRRFESYGLSPFIEEWKSMDCLYNQHISLKSFNTNLHGLVKGINHTGHLLLELADGSIQPCSSGDTTILKNS